MNKKTGILIGIIALAVVIGLMAAAFVFWMPKGQPGEKTITVTVTHGDGSEKEFRYSTEEAYLGPVLLAEGLVEGTVEQFGLYVKVVDGEKAVYEEDGAYWSLSVDGQYATTGVDVTPIRDGGQYALVYTRG